MPAVGACAAVAVLAACSGTQQGATAALPATTQNVAAVAPSDQHTQASPDQRVQASLDMLAKTLKSGSVPAQHRLSRKSWISPNYHKRALIYASDYTLGTVDIYDYATTKEIGQITGLDYPYGQCVDKAHNVYVVDFGTAGIYEYSHGAINYFNYANDNYGYPIGCAVNPTNGDVAVANFQGFNYTTGGIVVFKGGLKGKQKFYTQPSLYYAWPPGYDGNGNLFVEGYDESETATALEKLPHDGKNLKILTGVSFGYPAGVQGDGDTILAADQGYNGSFTTAIYKLSTSGSTAHVTHTSVLTDDCAASTDDMDSAQPFAYKGRVLAGNGYCLDRFGYWSLTYGGNPLKLIPAIDAPYKAYGESVTP
jgi:hypothetical protein